MAARKKARKGKAKARAAPAGWRIDRGGKSMSLRLRTENFMEAVAIIDAIAPVAEALEHHPDFHLERWNRLRVTTYSHDVGHLTGRDDRLARRINEVLAALK